jgi:hypothetical protein
MSCRSLSVELKLITVQTHQRSSTFPVTFRPSNRVSLFTRIRYVPFLHCRMVRAQKASTSTTTFGKLPARWGFQFHS